MDLLLAPVPLFDWHTSVQAYLFRYQSGNNLLKANRATGALDGAMLSPLLEMINQVGVEAFSMGKPVFVPVSSYMLLANLQEQCTQPPDKIIFVIDGSVPPEAAYLEKMRFLRTLGFRFAIQRLEGVGPHGPVLELCDYILFDCHVLGTPRQKQLFQQVRKDYPRLRVAMTNIDSNELYVGLQNLKIELYTGRFYRVPLTMGTTEVSPLKANLINLINLVRDENFEFSSVAAIVQKDTALSVSLMRLVNSPYIGLSQKIRSIDHAVTMLGQLEVRKWVTTAVSRLLGADKPDELTRLSLLRAKFAENLAGPFGLGDNSQSLFLTGLFSVLDVILDMPMELALQKVRVTDEIRDALVGQSGPYGDVLRFIREYESANWQEVSRMLIVHDISPETVSDAYANAAFWYRDLLVGDRPA